jgi:predicted  nucleic acid-binding Zn-ribbon protein
MTDQELRELLGEWLKLARRQEAITAEQKRIKEQRETIEYPQEILTLAELRPYQLELARLQERERALSTEYHQLSGRTYDISTQVRKVLPSDVWYRYNGVFIGWRNHGSNNALHYREAERDHEG